MQRKRKEIYWNLAAFTKTGWFQLRLRQSISGDKDIKASNSTILIGSCVIFYRRTISTPFSIIARSVQVPHKRGAEGTEVDVSSFLSALSPVGIDAVEAEALERY